MVWEQMSKLLSKRGNKCQSNVGTNVKTTWVKTSNFSGYLQLYPQF